MNWQKLPQLWLLIFLVFLLLLLLNPVTLPLNAQSETEWRSQIYSLRGRVERLESEVRRLGQSNLSSNSSFNSSSGSTPPQIIDGELIGRSDPMFERLATLVIELKERIDKLEDRIKTIETTN